MKLTISHGGDWGGLIPDVFRSGKLILSVDDEIKIVLKDETLEELLGLLDNETQELWRKCQTISQMSDKQADMMRKFGKIVQDEYTEDDFINNQRKHLDKIYEAFFVFYNEYWNADVNTDKVGK